VLTKNLLKRTAFVRIAFTVIFVANLIVTYMRITLVFFFFMMVAHAGQAQFKSGTRMIGATIGSAVYNNGTSEISVPPIGSSTARLKSYNIQLNPILGQFLSDHTAVGVSLNINPAGNTTSFEENGRTFQKDKNNSFNIGAGGFIRNYFGMSGAWLPFGQLTLNAGVSSLRTSGFFYGSSSVFYKQTYTGKSSGGFFANASAHAGLTKMLNENTGLDLYIGYDYSYNKYSFKQTMETDLMLDGTIDERSTNETSSKFTNHGIVLGAGIQVFLGNKKK
jgi:hypothetical protein